MTALSPWIRLLRPGSWVKNFLVFAALLFSGRWKSPTHVVSACLVFAAFCSIASTLYIWNDWRDRSRDRRHPRKRHRPLAAGDIGGWGALGAALVTGTVTVIVVALIPSVNRPGVVAVLGAYAGLMVLYNLGFKNVFGVDMLLVAVGVMLRAVAGGVGIGVPLTHWFMLCLFFLCVLLVAGKRRHELRRLTGGDGPEHRPVLGHYSQEFLDRLITLTGAAAVVTYSLYTVEGGASQFERPALLPYSILFVVFGLMRYLYLLYVDERGGAPESLFLTDSPLLICVSLWVLYIVMLFAW